MNCKLRHITTLLFAILISAGLNAQTEIKIDAKYDHEIGFQWEMNSASTLNNAMLNAKGFLDQDLKDENLNRLKDLNRGGSYSDAKLFYRQNRKELWGIKNLGFYLALEWHYLDDYRFTKDLYKLVFYGNKDFAGQKANLSESGRHYINYYQFKGGLNGKSSNERHRYGVNIAFNLGNQINYFQFSEPSCLYTSPNGTELSLKMNAGFRQSDTSKTQWYQISGYGASIDLFYEYRKKDQFRIAVSAENLGFINWDANTLLFEENKQMNFSGIEVDNIFDMPDPLVQSSDTLMDYVYANSRKNAQRMMIPANLKLKYSQYFMSGKILASALVQYRVFSYSLPLYQLDAVYAVNKQIKLGPIVAYGGYTAFNAGLKLEFNFAKYYQIRLESRYLTGFIQDSFSGMGGFINFTYKI